MHAVGVYGGHNATPLIVVRGVVRIQNILAKVCVLPTVADVFLPGVGIGNGVAVGVGAALGGADQILVGFRG